MSKVVPCKACGRTGWLVNTNKKTGQISREGCIYCNKRGYIINIDKKEVKNGILEQKESS